MKFITTLSLLFGLSISFPGVAKDISGLYISNEPNGSIMIQLVETSDQKITGRFELYAANAHGAIQTVSKTLKGAMSGDDLMLEFAPPEVDLSATANLTNDILTLIMNGQTYSLRKVDISKYQKILSDVSNTAANVRQNEQIKQRQQAELQRKSDVAAAILDGAAKFQAGSNKFKAELLSLSQKVEHNKLEAISVTGKVKKISDQLSSMPHRNLQDDINVNEGETLIENLQDVTRNKLSDTVNEITFRQKQVGQMTDAYNALEERCSQYASQFSFDTSVSVSNSCSTIPHIYADTTDVSTKVLKKLEELRDALKHEADLQKSFYKRSNQLVN